VAAVITAITCTGDRPLPFGLCIEYMARQSLKPDRWIIVDDGKVPLAHEAQWLGECCAIHEVQIWRRPPLPTDPRHTLSVNLLAALALVPSHSRVIFIEDDDWYAREHVEIVANELKFCDLVGFQGIVYYHVGKRCHRTMGMVTSHSSLCQTGITTRAIPLLKRICSDLTAQYIDLRLWGQFIGPKKLTRNLGTVVGIKGLPGRPGLTLGWTNLTSFTPDPGFKYLESLIGEDVEHYRQILPASQGPSQDEVRQPNSAAGSPG
jgi:hypothetical protein